MVGYNNIVPISFQVEKRKAKELSEITWLACGPRAQLLSVTYLSHSTTAMYQPSTGMPPQETESRKLIGYLESNFANNAWPTLFGGGGGSVLNFSLLINKETKRQRDPDPLFHSLDAHDNLNWARAKDRNLEHNPNLLCGWQRPNCRYPMPTHC